MNRAENRASCVRATVRLAHGAYARPAGANWRPRTTETSADLDSGRQQRRTRFKPRSRPRCLGSKRPAFVDPRPSGSFAFVVGGIPVRQSMLQERECRTCGKVLGPGAIRRCCSRRCLALYGHPTRSEIRQRAAAIRRSWSADTEQQRRVTRCLPVMTTTISEMTGHWL